ncbi:dynamin family protein [Virgibacillus ainsalahensis]
MTENKDPINATKIMEMFEKNQKEELIVSFAGHFSAGKSSMINSLLGEDILPKSPIPTSANVVKINSGEGVARVFFKHQLPVEYQEPYDIDMIKEYSKDKDAIKKIEISTAKNLLPAGASIMDTPGIDAADDADRLMTESSMHLVDVLYYVMDYNHVQSEVNLQFLKSVQKKKIPYYVIINQVDKHDESEIAFEMFNGSVVQTFDLWGLNPEEIFYSSILYPDTEYNQFNEIKRTLFSIMESEKAFYFNIDNAVNQIVNEHKHFLKLQFEDELSVHQTDNDVNQSSLGVIEELESQVKLLTDEPAEMKEAFTNELKNTLKNAYLMPSSLRDKAQKFLESQKSDFKIGLFGSKKRTAEERESRASALLSSLQENIEASVQWKLRDKFINILKRYDINEPKLQKQVQELSVTYTEKDLLNLIKPGAQVNGDYVLNYTNDLAADIKSKYKRESLQLYETIHRFLTRKNKELIEEYEKQLTQLQEARELKAKQDSLRIELDEKYSFIDNQLDSAVMDQEWLELLQREIESKEQSVPAADHFEQTCKEDIPKPIDQVENEPVKEEMRQTDSIQRVTESVDQTLQIIEDLPGFQAFSQDLESKHHRLTNRSYTIALFGAFSAGKSSFANALLGESVLPVSPNPTTAAVNRICPPTKSNPHGTVVVTLKNHETLKNDLLMITKNFSPMETDFSGLLQWIQEKEIHQDDQLNKMYQTYLKAMIAGFQENETYIGKKITITLEEFAAYVTDETKACYIESIDLYYDSPLTDQGITLVDTPGADSVNARHTNVAFEYIKHADAILYVTYYNHALSRADKDFLMQLGRVKEAFELDKMFFIVNAADLAANLEELKLVTDYVKEQLIQLGIRFPRLYPVSSKQSLQNKQDKQVLNENMQHFEEGFYQFIHNDLAALTVKSTLWDIKRVQQTMRHYIEALNMNEKEKEKQQRDLLSKKELLEENIATLETHVYIEQIEQKIEKQLFYVLERITIRYHDMFKETFNPTTITESGRKAQTQLRTSLQNLIDYVGFELLQEIQAVSLRVEKFIHLQATEVYDDMQQQEKKIDETLVFPEFEPSAVETPVYEQAFKQMDTSEFNQTLAKFNGTKAFFVKNEKELMKENIFSGLEPQAKQYLEDNKTIMSTEYLSQWEAIIEDIRREAVQHIQQHINSYLEMMNAPIDMIRLSEKQQELDSIIDKHDIKEVQ